MEISGASWLTAEIACLWGRQKFVIFFLVRQVQAESLNKSEPKKRESER